VVIIDLTITTLVTSAQFLLPILPTTAAARMKARIKPQGSSNGQQIKKEKGCECLHKSTRDKMQKRNSRIRRGAKHDADPARKVMQDPSSAPIPPGEGKIQREKGWKVSV